MQVVLADIPHAPGHEGGVPGWDCPGHSRPCQQGVFLEGEAIILTLRGSLINMNLYARQMLLVLTSAKLRQHCWLHADQ